MASLSRAELADLPELMDLENRLFTSDCISRRQFRYLLTKANGIAVKLTENHTLYGYMVLLKRKRCSNLRVYSICVDESVQQRGFGRVLLDYAEEVAVRDKHSSVTLEVSENNSAAIKFYQAGGYCLTGRKIRYYEDGSTALLFKKNINQVSEQ